MHRTEVDCITIASSFFSIDSSSQKLHSLNVFVPPFHGLISLWMQWLWTSECTIMVWSSWVSNNTIDRKCCSLKPKGFGYKKCISAAIFADSYLKTHAFQLGFCFVHPLWCVRCSAKSIFRALKQPHINSSRKMVGWDLIWWLWLYY